MPLCRAACDRAGSCLLGCLLEGHEAASLPAGRCLLWIGPGPVLRFGRQKTPGRRPQAGDTPDREISSCAGASLP